MTREEREQAIRCLKIWIEKEPYLQTYKTCLEALEQELCEDAISRQAVIDITWEEPSYTDALNVLTEVRDKVKALPSVKPQEPKWIPVSERLPEYMVSVLTWDGGAICIEKRIPYILDDNGEPIESDWWVNDEYEDGSEYYPNLRDGAAIAWMPLPTSYEPQEGAND